MPSVNGVGFRALRCERPDPALGVLDEPRFTEVGSSPGRPILQFRSARRSVRHICHFLRKPEQPDDLRHQFVDRRATAQAFQRLDRWVHQFIEGWNFLLPHEFLTNQSKLSNVTLSRRS